MAAIKTFSYSLQQPPLTDCFGAIQDPPQVQIHTSSGSDTMR